MPTNPTDLAHRMNPGFADGHHSFTPQPRTLSPIERLIDGAVGYDPKSPVFQSPPAPKLDDITKAMLNLCTAACLWNRKYKSEPHRKRAEAKLRKAVEAYRALGGW